MAKEALPQMTDSKAYDRKRQNEKPWRKWYSSPRWRGPGGRRQRQLADVPWCQTCKLDGRATVATVVNHLIPHRGDPYLFWHGKLESVCKECHDSRIQSAEAKGFRIDIDDDGWPLDPDHPFNRKNTANRNKPEGSL